jgi:hypothetical protein
VSTNSARFISNGFWQPQPDLRAEPFVGVAVSDIALKHGFAWE